MEEESTPWTLWILQGVFVLVASLKIRNILNWFHSQSKKHTAKAKQQLKSKGFELDD